MANENRFELAAKAMNEAGYGPIEAFMVRDCSNHLYSGVFDVYSAVIGDAMVVCVFRHGKPDCVKFVRW